jgi:hypothetical protein
MGEDAIFPGTEFKYNSFETFSSATMNAHLAEWCALTPHADGQAYNAVNGDLSSWSRTFPDLASFFGLKVSATQFSDPPRNHFKKGNAEMRNGLTLWAQDPKVVEAWERLAQREGLDREVFHQASWPFADAIICMQYSFILEMNKARKHGYFGFVDSSEDFFEVFRQAQELKFLPKYDNGSGAHL